MRYSTHLIIFSLLAVFALSGCSAGQRAFSKGELFEAEGKYEEAMYSYAEAFRNDNESSEFRIRFLKARDLAANQRFNQGRAQFEKGNYVAALADFQAALGLDPTQGRFRQQVEATTRLKDAQLSYQEGLEFEKANKFKDATRMFAHALELHPDNKEYQAAQTRVAGLRKSRLEGYELNLKSTKPITLKFKDAKLKDVFNIITQLSGINFVFDEAIKDQPVTIYLENATFQQALDLLSNMFKLGRKIANESTVIIFPKTPDKSKQYDDMTLRTFHLNYMDAKKAINLVRTMLQVRKIYVNEETNSIVVRDTGDVVDVIEKILDANDVPDAEVILDIEVLEISDTNAQNLGLLLSNYNIQLGAFNGANLLATSLKDATAATTTTTVTTLGTTSVSSNPTAGISNLVQLFATKGGYGGFFTVPNAQYNFEKSLGKAEVLSNPKIRVKNKEKSKFTVGTRLPITTSNTTNSTVSVNVQYVDVGVKVSAEPTIQLNNEIVIKLSLEVSQQVGAPRDVGAGTTVVTIGTRNLDTVLSLKDGETSIIGGLIQKFGANDKKKLFLLSDIPLLGELFTNTNSSNNKTELLLAITPRLVRGVSVPQNNLMSFGSGKEDDPTLTRSLASFDQEPIFEGAAKPLEKQPAAKPAPAAAPAPAIKPLTAPAAPTAAEAPKPGAVTPQSVAPPITRPAALPAQPTSPTPPGMPMPQFTAPPNVGSAAVQPGVPPQMTSAPLPSFPAGTVMQAPVAPSAAAAAAVAAAAVPAAPAAQPAQRGLLQISAPQSASVGQQFSVEVKTSAVSELSAAPFVLTYDPLFVEFVSAAEGDLLKQGGMPTIFSSTGNPAAGTVTISLSRRPGSVGVSGAGSLATILFRAKNKGPASFGFRNVAFSAADGRPLTILPFNTAVEIK